MQTPEEDTVEYNGSVSSLEYAAAQEFSPDDYLVDEILLKYRDYFHAHRGEGDQILDQFVKHMLADPDITEPQREWICEYKDVLTG